MSKDLLQTLDALNNSRPRVMSLKKHNLDLDRYPQASQREQLEWMRLNTERERILIYKQLTNDHSEAYYAILDEFVQVLDRRKEQEIA
jgi:hypothetical protein